MLEKLICYKMMVKNNSWLNGMEKHLKTQNKSNRSQRRLVNRNPIGNPISLRSYSVARLKLEVPQLEGINLSRNLEHL